MPQPARRICDDSKKAAQLAGAVLPFHSVISFFPFLKRVLRTGYPPPRGFSFLQKQELLLRDVLSDIQGDRDVDDDTKCDPLRVRVDAQELQRCFQEFEDRNTDDGG